MSITDTRLGAMINRVNNLIRNGKFVWVKEYNRDLSPYFPVVEQAKGYRYENYRETTDWGVLEREYDGYYTVTRPEGLPEQKQIALVSGEITDDVVIVCLPAELQERYGGKEVVIPLPNDANEYTLIRYINKELGNDGFTLCVTNIEGKLTSKQTLRLSTDDVIVPLVNAVIDPNLNMVVAMTLVVTDRQTLIAIRATMATNSRKSIKIVSSDYAYYLNNAQRGYRIVSTSLESRNIKGNAVTMIHPLAVKPEDGEPFFWLLTRPGEDIREKFGRVFPHQTMWPTRPEWSHYLIKKGLEEKIVRQCKVLGTGFETCYQILDTQAYESDPANRKNWKYIISNGLKLGEISL